MQLRGNSHVQSGKYSFSDDTKTKLRNSYGTMSFSSSELNKEHRLMAI